MGSLHRHLQYAPAAHDRLAFRPDCPRCQARLLGRYPEPRPLNRRGEAATAAGLAAVGALLPAGGALAREPQPGVPTPGAPPATVEEGDQGGNELPPLLDEDRGGEPGPSVIPRADPQPEPSQPPGPTPQPQASEPPASGGDDPAPGPPGPPASGGDDPAPGPPEPPASGGDDPAPGPSEPPASGGDDSSPGASEPSEPPASSADDPPPDDTVQATPRADQGRTSSEDRHIVQPGESLWLIAEDQLDDEAGDAAVAAEVERLWELNTARIATGDPDLIYPGQSLRLR